MNKETKVDQFIDMELRDWFAGQALAHLAGMLHPGAWSPAEVARRAYEIADNMMLFRSRE